MTIDGTPDEVEKTWWYNSRTGEVEHGPQSTSLNRVGPFASEAEARRAPELLQERSRAWAEDESREDSWGETS